MTDRHPGAWHVTPDDLAAYIAGRSTPPVLWSVEAHLSACAPCRGQLTALAGPAPVEAGWRRLDAALDAPVPGTIERLLAVIGVPDHTARLLAATPALRVSWLGAVVVTLVLVTALAQVAGPSVFLVLAPLLPLVGVAASFGPGLDPTHEITLAAPIHTFRLLLLRCVAVLSANSLLSAVASLFMTGHGLSVAGWFLPSLALTILALALTPRLGSVGAALAVGAAWTGLVVLTSGAGSGLFTPAGQLAFAVGGAVAALALRRQAAAFDSTRLFAPSLFRRLR